MEASFWALIPPILAIIISLITKEVNYLWLLELLSDAAFIADLIHLPQ